MKFVEIKKGNKTIYKHVSDDWESNQTIDFPTGDLTTGSVKSLNMGLTQEQYDTIFGGMSTNES